MDFTDDKSTVYFDELIDRRNSGSLKWDSKGDTPDVIPLWVADMDFKTAPPIITALRERVNTGIFGYVNVGESYYDSLINWNERRHGWLIDRKKVIYTTGVVPAISAIIMAMTKPGNGVILQTPAYNCFFSSIRNNGCKIVENPLRRIDCPVGFSYEIDFEQLEKLAADENNVLLILCNPHNPSGRVWRRDELLKIRDICKAYGVRVISDEIHCELIHPGCNRYIPYAVIDQNAIVCISPSKAFNTAGLQIANIICPDNNTLRMIDRAINDNEVCDVNPFGVIALQVAYNQCEPWLISLIDYLQENYLLLRRMLSDIHGISICDSESTYLAWIDISGLRIDGLPASGNSVEDYLLRTAKVRVAGGSAYRDNGYIRINYACPRNRLKEALHRIRVALMR